MGFNGIYIMEFIWIYIEGKKNNNLIFGFGWEWCIDLVMAIWKCKIIIIHRMDLL